MSFNVDCVSSPSNSALSAAGVTGLCRYLSWLDRDTLGKIIHQAEYDRLIGGGFGVILNWEFDARDWLGGGAAGAQHATEAVRQARALGYPVGCAIPGSADFDMTPAQWDSVGRSYAVAYSGGLYSAGYRAGVYGPWDVLSWCQALGSFDMFWQSMSTAFSAGRNAHPWPGVHLRQRGTIFVGGAECDNNDIMIDNYFQAGGPVPIVPGTNGRDDLTCLSDLWCEEQNGHSGFVPTDKSARQKLLETLLVNSNAILAKLGQPQTVAVTLDDATVAAIATQVAAAHPALGDADVPVIETAVKAVLRGGVG